MFSAKTALEHKSENRNKELQENAEQLYIEYKHDCNHANW